MPKAKKSRKSASPSISPTRCSTPSLSPTKVLCLPVPNKRSVSPLKNIDVPYSNLDPVKEETEHSSSQSEDTTDTLNLKNKQVFPINVLNLNFII
jgi:hypothetical protein